MPPKFKTIITKPGKLMADILVFACESCSAPVRVTRYQQTRRKEKNRWRCAKCGLREGMIDRVEKSSRAYEETHGGAAPKLRTCKKCGRQTVNYRFCDACFDALASYQGDQGEVFYGGLVRHGRVSRGATNAA